jgi:hypothetical protein
MTIPLSSLTQLPHAHSSIVQTQSMQQLVSLFAEIITTLDKKLTGFLVCMKIVPGPVNLHTNPSPLDNPEMMPPEATLSRIYFVFQATRWPLSTIYLSPSASYISLLALVYLTTGEDAKHGKTYIFPNNRPHTTNPEQSHSANLVDKQPLSTEHRLSQSLPLILFLDTVRAS